MSDSIEIPDNKTCGDCIYFKKCNGLVGAEKHWASCDFFPIRFKEQSEK